MHGFDSINRLVPTKTKSMKSSFGPATHSSNLGFSFGKTYLSCFGLPLDVSELISELIPLIPNAIKVLFLPLQGLATHRRKDKRVERRQRRSWIDCGHTSSMHKNTLCAHIKPTTSTEKQTDDTRLHAHRGLGKVQMCGRAQGLIIQSLYGRQIFLT